MNVHILPTTSLTFLETRDFTKKSLNCSQVICQLLFVMNFGEVEQLILMIWRGLTIKYDMSSVTVESLIYKQVLVYSGAAMDNAISILHAVSAMLYLLCFICYTLSAMLYLLCFICYTLHYRLSLKTYI